jgi:hypothetical protein
MMILASALSTIETIFPTLLFFPLSVLGKGILAKP